MPGLIPFNFLFNLTDSHLVHFSSVAGTGAGDLGCAGHGGLFHLPEDLDRVGSHIQHWHRSVLAATSR